MSSSKGGFAQKSIDGIVFGYEFEVSSINAQKINIIGGLIVNDAHDNVKIGTDAAFFLTSGSNNVLLGNTAGYYLTTGTSNVAIGLASGHRLGSATRNVFLGNFSGFFATGNDNLALGTDAGRGLAAWSGYNNVFLGSGCGYSGANDYNTAVGFECGFSMGAGATQNTLVGYKCGRSITSADQCTMLGVEAGYATTTSTDSIVIDATNRDVVVKDGESPLGPYTETPITLTNGTYTVAQLATELQTQLKAAIDVNFAVVKTAFNQMRVTLGTPNWQFQFLFGSGAPNGLAKVLTPGRDTALIESSGVGNYLDLAVKLGRLVLIGYRSGYNNNGTDSVMMGTNAGAGESGAYTASNCVYIGNGCARATGGGNYNTAIGFECGYNMAAGAIENTFLGFRCGYALTTGKDAVYIGYLSGYHNNGDSSVMIGTNTGAGTAGVYTASDCVCIGTLCATDFGGGPRNCLIGFGCGRGLTTCDYSVMIGYLAGQTMTTGTNNVLVGNNAGGFAGAKVNSLVALGTEAGLYATVKAADGVLTDTSNHVCVGHNAGKGAGAWKGSGSVYIGKDCGLGLSGTADSNVLIGYECGKAVTTGSYNVMVGYQTGLATTTTSNNVMMGFQAGGNATTAGSAVCIGYQSGFNNNGSNSVMIGTDSGKGANGVYTASDCVYIGTLCAHDSGGGSSNCLIGHQCGKALTTCSASVMIGYLAGFAMTTGNNNVLVGNQAGSLAGAAVNSLVAIGTQAGQRATVKAIDGVLTDTSNHVCVGYNAGKGAGAWNGSGSVYIGKDCGLGLVGTADSNVLIGYECGKVMTTGSYNVMMGYKAGNTNTTGTNNALIGYNVAGNGGALVSSVVALGPNAAQYVGSNNHVCLGVNAGKGVGSWTGMGSVYIGTDCGAGLSGVADSNVFVGFECGKVVTEGDNNVLVGYQCGLGLTTGNYNVAIGTNALSASTIDASLMVAIGTSAGQYSDTSSSVCIGTSSGKGLELHKWSTLWTHSGTLATTNYPNIFIGTGSGENARNYSFANVCLGINAGKELQTQTGTALSTLPSDGVGNTFIGFESGKVATTAKYNTCIGMYAGQNITTGANNTFIGDVCGGNLTTGRQNIAIGYSVGPNDLAATNPKTASIRIGSIAIGSACNCNGDNSIAIGYGDILTPIESSANMVNIGIKGTNQYSAGAFIACTAGFTNGSDRRLKTDIVPMHNGLDIVAQLNPCKYRVINGNGKLCFGFIAQEIETIGAISDIVTPNENPDLMKCLTYQNFHAIAIAALKELLAKNNALEQRVAALEMAGTNPKARQNKP